MGRMTNVYRQGSNGTMIPYEITGTVTSVKRHGHTIYGNPIMSVYLDASADDGTDWSGLYRISDNAALVYAIENTEFRDVAHTFHLTRAGRISHVQR